MASKLTVIFQIAAQGMDVFQKVQKQIGNVTGKVTSMIKSLASIPNAIAAFGLYKITQGFYKAGESLEIFHKQLLSVAGSAEEADQALAAIREFARVSPLGTEDVVKSYVRLRAVGINPTIAQMRTLGGVSLLFHQQMTDTMDAFIGLNKKTLRTLGVEIDRTGKKAILSSENIRMEVEKNSPAIRAALIDIWEKRFPNAIDKAATTFSAKMEVFRSNIWEIQAQMGEVFLNAMGNSVDEINKKFEWLIPRMKALAITIVETVRIVFKSVGILTDYVAQQIIEVITLVKADWDSLIAYGKLALENAKNIGAAIINPDNEDVANKLWNGFSKFKEQSEKIKTEHEKAVGYLKKVNNEYEKDTSNKVASIVSSIDKIQNAWGNVNKPFSKLNLPGTGTLGGGGSEGGSGGGSDNKKGDLFGVGKALQGSLDKFAEYNKFTVDIMYDQLSNFNIKMATDSELLAMRLKDIWIDFTDSLEGRFRNAFFTLVDLHGTAMQKFQAISEQAYNATMDLLWEYVAAFVKAQFMKQTVGVATEKMMQRENMTTAATAGAGAAAEAGKSVAKVPFVGPMLAIGAIALVFGAITRMLSKSKGFAGGTNNAPAGYHWVGEQGPELMKFRGGEQVISNSRSRGMGQSVTVSPTIVINGNADQSTVRAIGDELNRFGKNFEMAIRNKYINLNKFGFVRA